MAKRKDQVLVLQPKAADGSTIVEAELLPPKPNVPEPAELSLKRTAKYQKSILTMSEEEVHKTLHDQMKLKLLLINERVLAELELLETAEDWKQRAAIAMTIETLTRSASAITQAKAQLEKALGADMKPMIPSTAPTVGEPEGEISAEEFEAEYLRKAASSGTMLVRPGRA